MIPIRKSLKKAAAGALALSMMVLGGCSASSSKDTIAVIVKSQGSAYWDYLRLGVNDAAGETGYDIYFDAPPTEADIDIQEQLVLDAIGKKVKAIVIAPIDADSLNDELAQADAAGIPVVCVDSDCSFEQKRAFISSNNLNAGSIEGRNAGELLLKRNGGTVAIVGHTKGAGNAIGRIGGFVDALVLGYGADVSGITEDNFISGSGMTYADAIAKGKEVRQANGYPEIKIVGLEYCDAKQDIAMQNTEAFLTQYPDLTMLFATNQQTTTGACQKVNEMGMKGKVLIMGFDSGEDQINAMTTGTLQGLIAQSPYNMGYLGVRYAHKCINGEKIPSLVDTGVTYVDLTNLNDPEVQLLLNPQTFENYDN